MNKDQRKFLVDQVSTTAMDQIHALEHKRPEMPSLNNYLIAAFLDNSIKFNDIDALKEKLRQRVLKMGTSDVLIEESSSYRSSKTERYVKIVPEDLFIIPESYKKALDEYEKIKADLEKQIDDLRAKSATIILKLQVGSDLALQQLVQSIDNIANLELVNTQLSLKQ
jgi:hypothetical protein